MNEMNAEELKGQQTENENVKADDATNLQNGQPNAAEEAVQDDNVADEKEVLQRKYSEISDAYLRLMAEFDNYRKRTLREKTDLIKTGGEKILTGLLPVVDDFERAIQNVKSAKDIASIAEGVELIYSKFMSYLAQQGVKPINAVGEPFDTESFEAIATIPAPEEQLKGKVLDCTQTGYTLHDKVIRHSKVVVGE